MKNLAKRPIPLVIKNHRRACMGVMVFFIKKHFPHFRYHESNWRNGIIGGNYEVNDMYFDYDDILLFIEKRLTTNQIFAYYNWRLNEEIGENYVRMTTRRYIDIKLDSK